MHRAGRALRGVHRGGRRHGGGARRVGRLAGELGRRVVVGEAVVNRNLDLEVLRLEGALEGELRRSLTMSLRQLKRFSLRFWMSSSRVKLLFLNLICDGLYERHAILNAFSTTCGRCSAAAYRDLPRAAEALAVDREQLVRDDRWNDLLRVARRRLLVYRAVTVAQRELLR